MATGITAAVLFDRTIMNYAMYAMDDLTPYEYAYLDPSYYQDTVIPPPLAFERHVDDVADFEGWRNMLANPAFHISDNIHPEPVMLGPHPRSDKTAVERFLLGDIIVWHASPQASNGRAVLVVPGSGDGAAREIMGVYTEKDVPYHGEIGLRLAESGYHAYTLELDGWGERQKDVGGACPKHMVPVNCEFYAFRESLGRYGVSLDDIHDREVATVMSYVADRHEWVAVSGLSAGAWRALTAALANHDVVNATVLASGIMAVHEWPIFIVPGWGSDMLDPYDVEDAERAGALAPTPLYVSYGMQETGLTGYAAKTGDVRDTILPMYEMHDARGGGIHIRGA